SGPVAAPSGDSSAPQTSPEPPTTHYRLWDDAMAAAGDAWDTTKTAGAAAGERAWEIGKESVEDAQEVVEDPVGFVEDQAVGVYQVTRDSAEASALRFVERWRSGDHTGAVLGAGADMVKFHFDESPFSLGGALFDEDTRELFSEGEIAGGVGRTAVNALDMFNPFSKARHAKPNLPGPKGGKGGKKDGGQDGQVLADGEKKPDGSDSGDKSDSGDGGKKDDEDSDSGVSCPNNSFVPGTPVLAGDGSLIPIEEIQVGDEVWAFDPLTGEEGPRQVTAPIEGQGEKTLVKITITDDSGNTETVTATDEHPFWAPEIAEWVDAIDVQPGTWLRTSAGSWVQVSAVEAHSTTDEHVYNLTVEGLHTYFVSTGPGTNLLVHNELPCGDASKSYYELDYVPTKPNVLYLGSAESGYKNKARENGGIHLGNTSGLQFEEKFKEFVNDADAKIEFDVSTLPGKTLDEKIKNAVDIYETMDKYGIAKKGEDGLLRPDGNGGYTTWELYYLSKKNLIGKVDFSGI
ncbi:polymorphic toxin-type HINT domain-containing protein, partial [Nocardiopsis gilva]